jgi:hypothetical protein
MDVEQILNLYDWSLGVCFRHPAKGEVLTAHVWTVRPPAGGIQDIRACKECVASMEEQRRRAAARKGWVYKPGELAPE